MSSVPRQFVQKNPYAQAGNGERRNTVGAITIIYKSQADDAAAAVKEALDTSTAAHGASGAPEGTRKPLKAVNIQAAFS